MKHRITFAKFIDILSGSRKDSKYIFLPELLDAFTGGKLNNGELNLPNLCDDVNPNTLKSKANGTRVLSKDEATKLFKNCCHDGFETYLNDLIYDCDLLPIRNMIVDYGFKLSDALDNSQIPEVCAELFEKIIYDLSYGRTETLPPLKFLDLKLLGDAAFKKIYVKDDSLFVNGEKIPLSKSVFKMDFKINEDLIYVKKLFDVYTEKLGRKVQNALDIKNTKCEMNLQINTRFYFEARYKENAAREIFEDGENEFEAVKSEIYDAICNCLLFKKHEDGWTRLNEVMDLVVKAQLNNSLLLRISGFINSPTRQGILHILVEEGRIKSWVDEK